MSEDKVTTTTKPTKTRKGQRETGGKMTVSGIRSMRKQLEKMMRNHVKRATQCKAAIKLLGKF